MKLKDFKMYTKSVWLDYTRVFSIGKSTHKVDVYERYSRELGLLDKLDEIESGRVSDILKELKKYNISTEQLNLIKNLMSEKSDGIASPEGKYYKY